MTPPRPLLRRIAFVRRNRCGVLLAALGLFIVMHPLISISRSGTTALNIGMVAILMLGVWALRVRRFALLSMSMLGVLALLAVLAARHGDVLWLRPVGIGAIAIFFGGVTISLLRYVLDPRLITTDKVFGAVAAYVLIALTFALVFGLLQMVQPDAFHVSEHHDDVDGRLGWMGMMYFSFTVLTSTGFGEITPVTDMARSLIVIEQVLGVMYVAFLIARLANLYGRDGQR
jgi:ion channel